MVNSTIEYEEKLTLAQALSKPEVAISCSLLLLLMILIMVGNLTVMRTVYMTPKLHYAAFYFVVSLAVADFMVGFLVPLSIVYIVAHHMTKRWMAGEVACDLWTFANIWLVVASLLNLCVVSWDRYVAVTSPFTYKLRMRCKKVKILITLVWLVSLIIGILYTVTFKYSKTRELCKTSGLELRPTITFFVLVYSCPTLFLLFANTKVIILARKHRRHIRALEVKPTWITEGEGVMEIKNDRRKSVFLNEIKTFKMFAIVIGTFVVCYSPFFILLLLHQFLSLPESLPHVTIILFYVKSGLNPMIYGASKDLRVAAVNSLRNRRRVATDVTDLETHVSAHENMPSVLSVPHEEQRVPSPIKIDDIVPRSD